MKFFMKKPKGSVKDMEVVPGTERVRRSFDALGKVTGAVETRTLRYPENHPRAIFKQEKKEWKKIKRH